VIFYVSLCAGFFFFFFSSIFTTHLCHRLLDRLGVGDNLLPVAPHAHLPPGHFLDLARDGDGDALHASADGRRSARALYNLVVPVRAAQHALGAQRRRAAGQAKVRYGIVGMLGAQRLQAMYRGRGA
jgi:hypothetical protein